jgi:hypothetical protein
MSASHKPVTLIHILVSGESCCVGRQGQQPGKWPAHEAWVAPDEIPWVDDRLCLHCVNRYTRDILNFNVVEHAVNIRAAWMRENGLNVPREPHRLYLTDRTIKQVEAYFSTAGDPTPRVVGGMLYGMIINRSDEENDYVK